MGGGHVRDLFILLLHTGTILWLLHFPLSAVSRLKDEAAAEGIAARRLFLAPTAERSFHLARTELVQVWAASFRWRTTKA